MSDPTPGDPAVDRGCVEAEEAVMVSRQPFTMADAREFFLAINTATRRHPLLSGFAHAGPTVSELQQRLTEIVALSAHALHEIGDGAQPDPDPPAFDAPGVGI